MNGFYVSRHKVTEAVSKATTVLYFVDSFGLLLECLKCESNKWLIFNVDVFYVKRRSNHLNKWISLRDMETH